jgi:hypothetical protein
MILFFSFSSRESKKVKVYRQVNNVFVAGGMTQGDIIAVTVSGLNKE